jgi:hypothetical protein
MQRLSVPVREDYDLALLYWLNSATKTLVIFSHYYGGSKETVLNHARIVHDMGYSIERYIRVLKKFLGQHGCQNTCQEVL